MPTKSDADEYSPEEAAQRRDAAIKRALNTPAKHYSDYIGKGQKKAPQRKRSKVKEPSSA